MERVLVTGATGFVGSRVVKELKNHGFKVIVTTRSTVSAAMTLGSDVEYVEWKDFYQEPDFSKIKKIDVVINLMGENISSRRWKEEQKKIILDSRVIATKNLLKSFSSLESKPKVFLSASAIGIYGDKGDELLKENASFGDDFLAKVCAEWEKVVMDSRAKFERMAIFRIGVVLGKGGGAMKKMVPAFKLGVGGPIGEGKQFMSWIHVDDLSKMFVSAVTNKKYNGILNAVSPYYVTNKEFSFALAKILQKPCLFKTPKFALDLLMGEMSTVILASQKISNEKVKEIDFHYQYPTVELAIKDVLSK
jgi:uncharacterized protein (TIGR01777 family)